MPRANRFFLPGYVWHITHRCHQREFLLKFARDRQCWRYWLFEARRRYGLRVLNYIATSNHIHLLVQDRGEGEIAKSMQLVAGRTAQEYNQRKQRRGAYWEDRYHATAVDKDSYLARCMVYIDLNMVRAGVVTHPEKWDVSGYHELQNPPSRYRIIERDALGDLLDTRECKLSDQLREWTEEALQAERSRRSDYWSTSLAVGSKKFVDKFRAELGASGFFRESAETTDGYALREPSTAYSKHFEGEITTLRAENRVVLDENI